MFSARGVASVIGVARVMGAASIVGMVFFPSFATIAHRIMKRLS